MTSSTIQELLNKEFYLLEDPLTGLINVGVLKGSQSASFCGGFSSFDLNTEFALAEPDYQFTREEFHSHLLNYRENKRAQEDLIWQMSSEPEYRDSFQKALSCFSEDRLYKVVLYRSAVASIKNSFDIFFNSLICALEKKPRGYFYGFVSPQKQHILLGLAPEYLFAQNAQNELFTVAVAGTGEQSAPLLDDPKMMKEHEDVKKNITQALKVNWGQTEEKLFGQLKHLVTLGKIQETPSSLIARKLHPTSAVGRRPRGACLEEVQAGPEPRGFYGGYAEFFSQGMAFALVLIRGFEIKGNTLRMNFGGGVIQESVIEDELAELNLKFNYLRELWNL